MQCLAAVLSAIAIVLFFCVFLKLVATINAIEWIIRRGDEHLVFLDRRKAKRHDVTEADYFDSFDVTGGNFFPFGVKDYLARRYVATVTSSTPILGSVFDTLRRNLFTNSRIFILVPVYLVAASWIWKCWQIESQGSFEVVRYSLYALALVAMSLNIPLLAEHIVGYFVLGNYAEHFHMMSVLNKQSSDFMAKLKVLFIAIIGIVATGFGGSFATILLFRGITPPDATEIDIHIFSISNFIKLSIYCLYFVTTTLSTIGYGDIHAQNTYGRIVCILLEVSSFFLITSVVALFWSSSASAKS